MSVQPVISDYFSSDVVDLASWQPTAIEKLYLGVELSIGPSGGNAADLFQLVIASPEAIKARFAQGVDWRLGRGLMIVSKFEWREIVSRCNAIVARCDDESWDRVATKLARYFLWEYDDYIESAEELSG